MPIDSLPVFRRRLKNYLFCHSYPGAVQLLFFYRGLEAFILHLAMLISSDIIITIIIIINFALLFLFLERHVCQHVFRANKHANGNRNVTKSQSQHSFMWRSL